jgi:hypothetical protein
MDEEIILLFFLGEYSGLRQILQGGQILELSPPPFPAIISPLSKDPWYSIGINNPVGKLHMYQGYQQAALTPSRGEKKHL